MATVYSSRLFYHHELGEEFFTVPDDELWVVRTIAVFFTAPEGDTAQLNDADTEVMLWWVTGGISSAGVYIIQPDCRLILPSGSTNRCYHGTTVFGGTLDMSLHGYILSLP